MPETIQKEQPIPQLGHGSFSLADYRRNHWAAIAARGVNPEDVLVPSYWAMHAFNLKPWDRIDIQAEDGTWLGEYVVLGCDRTWARIHTLRVTRLTPADIAETQAAKENAVKTDAPDSQRPLLKADTYTVKYRGAKKWSVIRDGDNAVMAEGLAQKQDAEAWLKNPAPEKTAVTV